jgi:AhpD family alkylhydroperoxidase
MTSRLTRTAPLMHLIKPLIDLGKSSHEGIDPTLAELMLIRASQINGCSGCLSMHTRDARQHGETEERIDQLSAWRESPLYTQRERAALAWTETLTRLYEQGAPDEVYERLRAQFSEEEQIKLTLLIGTINAFNRLNVGFRLGDPGAAARKAA